MRFVPIILLFSLLLMSCAHLPAQVELGIETVRSPAGDGVERGGGGFSGYFKEYGRALYQDIKKWQKQFPAIQAQAINDAVVSYHISPIYTSKRPKDLKGIEQEAVTTSSTHTIEVHVPSWKENNPSEEKHIRLAVHEYFRASGYSTQDDNYELTDSVFVFAKKHVSESSLFRVSTDQKNLPQLHEILGGKALKCAPKIPTDQLSPVFIESEMDSLGYVLIRVLDEKGVWWPNSNFITQVSVGPWWIVVSYGDGVGSGVLTFTRPSLYGTPFSSPLIGSFYGTADGDGPEAGPLECAWANSIPVKASHSSH